MLLKLAQDTDAQTAVQWYKENTGVDVLASEVNYALKDPIRLQRYLQNQQSGAKLRNLYETRNLQIEDAIDSYLDVLQKGKSVTAIDTESGLPASYRKAENNEVKCGTCKFFNGNYCSLWNAEVLASRVCNSWRPKE